MDIDGVSSSTTTERLTPPREFCDSPYHQHSESSMNFDILDNIMESSSRATSTYQGGQVDDRLALDRPIDLNERFVTALDQLDARVEKFRKDALGLQEKRDFLLLSIDLIKSNDLLQDMRESEKEEIALYIDRVNSRLATVELNVRTVRDRSQEDSLSQVNALIDAMITAGDPVISRQRCQHYLNSCSDNHSFNLYDGAHSSIDTSIVDKKFESALLGCTLDDQKNIKKRLSALMNYLNKQTIHE